MDHSWDLFPQENHFIIIRKTNSIMKWPENRLAEDLSVSSAALSGY